MPRPSYRALAGQVGGYTPSEGYDALGGYYVKGSNGARTVKTTMPRSKFLGMSSDARQRWLRDARQWVFSELT